jgi:hypothetical protein
MHVLNLMVTSMVVAVRIEDSDDVPLFPGEDNRPLFPHLWMVPPVVMMVPLTPA